MSTTDEDIPQDFKSTEDGYGKFEQLCGGVSCNFALLMNCTEDLLQFMDELLKHNLPPSVLLTFTLITGKFYRRVVELGVSSNELVRLVKLYSSPWEEKSNALKKLHQDYESKQKKLEIALKKLELTEMRTLRMETERRVMNWEKLFAKLVGARSHGQRWRFLIQRFKQKLRGNLPMASFAASDTDSESDDDTKMDGNRMASDENENTWRMTEQKRNLTRKGVRFKANSFADDRHSAGSSTREKNLSRKQTPNIMDDFEDTEDLSEEDVDMSDSDSEPKINKVRPPRPGGRVIRQSAVGTLSPFSVREDTTLSDASIQTNNGVGNFVAEKADKGSWTHEPDYDTHLHVRIFKPECTSVVEPCCSLALGADLRRSKIFRVGDENYDELYKLSERTTSNVSSNQSNTTDTKQRHQDITFKLPESHRDVVEKSTVLDSLTLKVAVHAGKEKSAVAMNTIDVCKMVISENIDELETMAPYQLTLFSMVDAPERNLIFNKPCGRVNVLFFTTRVTYPKIVDSSTETLPMADIVDQILSESRREYLDRCKSAGVDTDEKPIYTEDEMNTRENELKEQLYTLNQEYEEKLDELLTKVNEQSQTRLRSVVSCCTSPIFKDQDIYREVFSPDVMHPNETDSPDEIPTRTENVTTEKPERRKKKKRIQWGKDLPEDFIERMAMFQEARKRHFQLLQEKVKDETMQDYMEKLIPFGHLQTSQNIENTTALDDLCLPALFMPSKTRTFCTPKARSYFHMAGTQPYRVTQPPPILSLPRLENLVIYPELIKRRPKSSARAQSAGCADSPRPFKPDSNLL